VTIDTSVDVADARNACRAPLPLASPIQRPRACLEVAFSTAWSAGEPLFAHRVERFAGGGEQLPCHVPVSSRANLAQGHRIIVSTGADA